MLPPGDTFAEMPDCYIDQFTHDLPHRGTAATRKCGHQACDPHTITYYGTGDDPEAEGDYCMVCYGRALGIWPDKTLQRAAEAADSGA
jgi:hypothetical protein